MCYDTRKYRCHLKMSMKTARAKNDDNINVSKQNVRNARKQYFFMCAWWYFCRHGYCPLYVTVSSPPHNHFLKFQKDMKRLPSRLAKNVLITVLSLWWTSCTDFDWWSTDIPGNSAMEKLENMMRDYHYLRMLMIGTVRISVSKSDVILPSTPNCPEAAYSYVVAENNFTHPAMSGTTRYASTAVVGIEWFQYRNADTFHTWSATDRLELKLNVWWNARRSCFVMLGICETRGFESHYWCTASGKVPVDVVYGAGGTQSYEHRFDVFVRKMLGACRLGEMVKVATREQHPVNHPILNTLDATLFVFETKLLIRVKKSSEQMHQMLWSCLRDVGLGSTFHLDREYRSISVWFRHLCCDGCDVRGCLRCEKYITHLNSLKYARKGRAEIESRLCSWRYSRYRIYWKTGRGDCDNAW